MLVWATLFSVESRIKVISIKLCAIRSSSIVVFKAVMDSYSGELGSNPVKTFVSQWPRFFKCSRK